MGISLADILILGGVGLVVAGIIRGMLKRKGSGCGGCSGCGGTCGQEESCSGCSSSAEHPTPGA